MPIAACTLVATDLNEVSFQALKDRGFQGVIFDKDNTLTIPHHHEIAAHLQVCSGYMSGSAAIVANAHVRICVMDHARNLWTNAEKCLVTAC